MIFKLLGILVGVYTGLAAVQGRVYAKSGPSGRTIVREATPIYFWVVIAIYAALSLALLLVF